MFVGQTDRRSDIQLHVFTDASRCAKPACLYINISNQDHKQPPFMIGRTKVLPLNEESIPKLELQAAVNGTRHCKFTTEDFQLNFNSFLEG